MGRKEVRLRYLLEHPEENDGRKCKYVKFPVDENTVELGPEETGYAEKQVVGNIPGKWICGYAFLHNGQILFIPNEVEHHVNVSSEIGVSGESILLEKCKVLAQNQGWRISGIPLTRELYLHLHFEIQKFARNCLLSSSSDAFKRSLEYAQIGSYIIAKYDGCHEFGICTMAVLPSDIRVLMEDGEEDNTTEAAAELRSACC